MAAAKLSQSEIDHMMAKYVGEPDEVEASSIALDKEILPYDFKHPKLVSKEQMRSLRNLHETFARNLSVALTNSLRTIVDVKMHAIDQVVYSEFVQSVAAPSALYLISVEELGGEAVIEIDPRFCIYAVEKQSGGNSKEMFYRREMTSIEARINSRTMSKVYAELAEAWEPFMKLTIEQHSYETNPENIQIISAVEPAIVVFYQIQVYDTAAPLNICYPYALLEEALSNSLLKFSNQMRKDELSPELRNMFAEHIKKVNVPVQAILGETKITIEELVNLEVGDAIPLDQRIDEPLMIKVNNDVKMTGYPGTKHNHKAMRVFEVFDKKAEIEMTLHNRGQENVEKIEQKVNQEED